MKLLLDEDSQGNLLVRLLRAAGQDGETVAHAELAGSDDATVLAFAKQIERVLLTRNGKDFLLLHQASSKHSGILIEHKDSDVTKNMSYEQIVLAIINIESSGWNIEGQIVSINAWR